MTIPGAANAWRKRGHDDARAGRIQRAPLRDDGGVAMRAYLDGYRAAAKAMGKRVTPA